MSAPRIVATSDRFEQQLPHSEFRWLYRYWRSRCDGARLPSRARISPIDFPGLLPRIYLVEVIRNEHVRDLSFRFRLAGTEHFLINQREITGLMLEEAFAEERFHSVRAAYSTVVSSREPLLTLDCPSPRLGREYVVYDRLLLPLASDGVTVDMLLGYLHRCGAQGAKQEKSRSG